MATKKTLWFVITIFLIIVYRVALDYVYIDYLSPAYSWYGFVDEHSLSSMIVSYLILSLSIPIVLPIFFDKGERLSGLIVSMLYLLSFVPTTSCIGMGLYESEVFIREICIYWLVFLSLEVYVLVYLKHYDCCIQCAEKIKRLFFPTICCIFLFTVIYVSARYTGFRINLDLMNVYELRAERFEYSAIVQYILGWATCIIPLIMGYFLQTKRYAIVFAIFVIQVLNFGIHGHKSILFMSILVPIAYFVCKNIDLTKVKIISIAGLLFVTILSYIEPILFDTINVVLIVIRRVLYVPAYFSEMYFEFFQLYPCDYFRFWFRHFGVETPYYPERIYYQIGDYFFPGVGTHANNGLYSDAVANMGTVGIFVLPILLVVTLYILDICTKNIDKSLYVVIACAFSLTFVSVFLTDIITSYGLAIVCVICVIMGEEKEGITPKIGRLIV